MPLWKLRLLIWFIKVGFCNVTLTSLPPLRTLTITVPGWTTALDGETTATSSSSSCRWALTWWEFSVLALSLSSTTETGWVRCTPLSRILTLLEILHKTVQNLCAHIFSFFSISCNLLHAFTTCSVTLTFGSQSGGDVHSRSFLYSGHGSHRLSHGARSSRPNNQWTGEELSAHKLNMR